MKKHIRLLGLGVVVTALLAVSNVALADRMEKSCDHDRKTSRLTNNHDGQIKRLNKLKEQLNLTPAQLPLWESFIAMPNHRNHERMDTQSTADRFHLMKENTETMYNQQLARIESMQHLYASLDPNQQALFDKVLKQKHH